MTEPVKTATREQHLVQAAKEWRKMDNIEIYIKATGDKDALAAARRATFPHLQNLRKAVDQISGADEVKS